MAKSQLRIGAVLSYINMAIGSLIPMIYTPIMLGLLGQSEYGLYKLANSVTSYLALISFGIGSAVVRYYTKYIAEGDKEGEENIYGLFNIIFAIISAITVIAGVVIALNIGLVYSGSLTSQQLPEMKILVIILALNTAVNFLCTPQNTVVTSHEKFLFLQLVNIILTVVNPIVNIVVLFFGFKSIGLVVSSFVITIIVRIVYMLYVKRVIRIKPRYNNLPKHLIKEILVFSFWIFVANVVSQMYSATDTIIIGALPALATIGVAIYNVGITFNTMMTNFATGLLSVLTPKINKMVFSGKSNSELTDLMIRIGRLQCYIVTLICSGFIAFGQPFIQLWAGKGYEDAYWVAIVTLIPPCIPLVQSVALNVIIAQNKHRFRSIVYFGMAVVNVIFSIIAIFNFGIIGAATVTGITALIGTGFIMNWYYWKKIHLEIPRFWQEVGNIYLVPIMMCIITLFISNFVSFYSWWALLIGIGVYTSVFCIVNWLFIMNEYEKDIFLSPFRKVFRIGSSK